MAQKNIDFGSFPDDPSADAIRSAFQKAQDNFTELYSTLRLTGVISLNRTPGIGVTVNQPTGNVILSANIACVQVQSTTLILNINSTGNRNASGSQYAALTQSAQTLFVDLPLNINTVNNISLSNTLTSQSVITTGISGFSGSFAFANVSNTLTTGNLQSTNANVANLSVVTSAVLPTLGSTFPVANTAIKIPGGSNTNVLTTDGAGNVYWGFASASGASGTSGAPGSSGTSGVSGGSGLSGVSGVSGGSGLSGFSGWSGFSGFSGLSGFSGFSAFSGVSGFSGLAGATNILTATDDTTTTALYPVMVSAAGTPTTPKVSTSKIYFNAATGTIYATSKSFNIPHPTKPGKNLIYGSLEGPENGVYLRGRTKSNFIQLPDYWSALVDIATTTIQLTPIGSYQKLCVTNIENDKITINAENSMYIDCYFTIFAERKDIAKLNTEI